MSENNFKINEHSLRTAISKVEPDKIITRGYNQRDLIEKIRYSDMVFLLLKGRLPSIKEGKLFNHVLVSFCDHGATPPSTQTARLVASSGSPPRFEGMQRTWLPVSTGSSRRHRECLRGKSRGRV